MKRKFNHSQDLQDNTLSGESLGISRSQEKVKKSKRQRKGTPIDANPQTILSKKSWLYNEKSLEVILCMEKFPYSKPKTKRSQLLKVPNYCLHNVVNVNFISNKSYKDETIRERRLSVVNKLLDLNESDHKNPPPNYNYFLSLTYENKTPLQSLIEKLCALHEDLSADCLTFFMGLLKIFLNRDTVSNLSINISNKEEKKESINYITAIAFFCLLKRETDVMQLILSSTWSGDIDYKKTFNQYIFVNNLSNVGTWRKDDDEVDIDTEIKTALRYSNLGSKIKEKTLAPLMTKINITLLSCLPWTVFCEDSLLDTVLKLARDNKDAKQVLSSLIEDSKTMLNGLLSIFPKVLVNLILEYSSVSLQGMADKINKLENRSNGFALLSCSIFNNNASVDLLQESAWLNFLKPV